MVIILRLKKRFYDRLSGKWKCDLLQKVNLRRNIYENVILCNIAWGITGVFKI
jgi:hypothetical protein